MRNLMFFIGSHPAEHWTHWIVRRTEHLHTIKSCHSCWWNVACELKMHTRRRRLRFSAIALDIGFCWNLKSSGDHADLLWSDQRILGKAWQWVGAHI